MLNRIPSILADDKPNQVDPAKWHPLIMYFQKFYGTGSEVHDSELAKISEELYRIPDIEKARVIQEGTLN